MVLNICRTLVLVALFVLSTTDGSRPRPPTVHLRKHDKVYQRQDFRLPLEVIPVSYKIHLTPFLDNATFDGRVEIATTPNLGAGGEVKTITLHVHPNVTVRTVDVLVQGESRGVRKPLAAANETNHFYVITLDKPISSNSSVGSVVVVMEYSSVLSDDMTGFYRSSYLNDQGQTEYLATTQFEPVHARKAFPCFDEPALKARFEVTVTAPAGGYSALFNTPAVGPPVTDSLGRSVFTFMQTPPMSTYLVATVVSKFESTPSTNSTHKVWSRPNAKTQRDFGARYAAAVMDALVQITGLPYETGNITKMDNVAIPDFKEGAMENWGLVTYKQRELLTDDTETPNSHQRSVVNIIAHEYAHQFFGNIVSPAWWNVLWLNEGFATYLMYQATAMVQPTWRMKEEFVVRDVHKALDMDERDDTDQMTLDEDKVLHPDSIGSRFSTVTYAKGGSVIAMVEHVLGTETFRASLKNYLTKMHLRAAKEEDLFDALAETATNFTPKGFSLQDFVKSWTNTAGFPLLTVTRDYAAGTAKVTQHRFLTSDKPPSSPPAWITPVNWATHSGEFNDTKPSAWLTRNETLQLPVALNKSSWIVVNNQRTGFYRVNYDEENWRLLTQQLLEDHSVFPPVTQAQLLDDALALARTGKLDYNIALDLTRYLALQSDFIPVDSASLAFSFILTRLRGSQYLPYCKSYWVQLKPRAMAARLDTPNVGLKDDDQLLENVARWSPETITKFLATRRTSGHVPAHQSRWFYCAQIRAGGPRVWEEFWQRYLTTNIESEKQIILSALACSHDQQILYKLLLKTTAADSGVRSQDRISVMTSVSNTPEGFDAIVKFLNEQIAAGRTNELEYSVELLVGMVAIEDEAKKVMALAEKLDMNIGGRLDEILQWRQKYEETVGQWCKSHANLTAAGKPL